MKVHILSTAIAAFCIYANALSQNVISLDGEWQFEIDKNNIGLTSQWWNRDLKDRILLPGSMPERMKGDDVTIETKWISSIYDSSYYFNPYMAKYREKGNVKFPFFLTPVKHYVGAAWYRRTINIPNTWKDNRVILYLERPHIETTIFINGKEVGHQMSLSIPHQYDLTSYLRKGKDNTLSIRIYNGIENVDVGQDSHSVTDQTQGDWNGIVGRMELQSRPQSYIKYIYVYPDVPNKSIRIMAILRGNNQMSKNSISLSVNNEGDNTEKVIANKVIRLEKIKTSDTVSCTLSLGDSIRLWNEFHPMLYRLNAHLANGDEYSTTFGMRMISTKGKQIYINDNPIWLRGTVENCVFPLTGYPPMDEESWSKIFRKCREYGLNLMRFHSYCPPEAAFSAADKVGFYLQPEGPTWPNHGVKLGNGMKIDMYLNDEIDKIIAEYGNHPSFCMLAAGNEPAGNWVKWTDGFVNKWKEKDNRHLYCSASVGGGWAWDSASEYHVKGGARGLDWNNHNPHSDDDYSNEISLFSPKGTNKSYNIVNPYISHEQGQWCAFPDFSEISKYTGVNKAANFEIFRDILRENGMETMAKKFLMASGKLQTLCYKYEIERNLRTKDYEGFQLLGLNDYSGQGTALVGVLNAFWQEKGYCDTKQWTSFCSSIVPLAKFSKFVFNNDEMFSIPVEIYNASDDTLKNVQTECIICDENNKEYIHNIISSDVINIGKNNSIGVINQKLHQFKVPVKLTLYINIINNCDGRKIASNNWDFWVYPKTEEEYDVKEIYITDSLDNKAIKILKHGGKVLITAAGNVKYGNDIKQTYMPVFWNTSWFKMRPPHTTGAYIDNGHPLFHNFPTDNWSNLNWWELLNNAQVMNLSEFPKDYQPIVQSIDTWHVSRKIGMIIEANIFKGKLIMTTIDISNDLNHRVVARQMRKSIIEYMKSNNFKPSFNVDIQIIKDLFKKTAPKVNMFTNDSPDELKPKLN